MIFAALILLSVFFLVIGLIAWHDSAPRQVNNHITVFQPIVTEEMLFPDDFYSRVGKYLIDYMQEEWRQHQEDNTFQ